MVDGTTRHDQTIGDLQVSETRREKAEHLELARGQPRRILESGRPWPTRNAVRAELAESAADSGRERASAELPTDLEGAHQRLLVACLRERQRGLVRTTEARPFGSRLPPPPGGRK